MLIILRMVLENDALFEFRKKTSFLNDGQLYFELRKILPRLLELPNYLRRLCGFQISPYNKSCGFFFITSKLM